MTDDDHEQIISEVFSLVRDLLARDELEFTILTIDEEGKRGRFKVDPRFMESGPVKDALSALLREAFRQVGIARYVLVAECWMDTRVPILPGPISRDRLDEYVAEYAKEYQRRGLSPEHGGGRDEIILMHVCDRKRSTFRVWTIDRDPITGKVRDLILSEKGSGPEVALAGRFVNLLGGDAN